MSQQKQTNTLIALAALVIVFAGLKAAASLLIPFLLAIFIAFVSAPMVLWFERNLNLNKFISFLLSLIIVVGILSIVVNILANSLGGFLENLPLLKAKLSDISGAFVQKLDSLGVAMPKEFDPSNILNSAGVILKSTSNILSKSFLIFLMVTFMLFETSSLNHKLELISRNNPKNLQAVESFTKNLNRYLVIKSLASLGTGVIIAVILSLMGVKYALLWGVMAFLLNFIPTIGSIAAAVPAILVSLVEYDVTTSLWVMMVFVATNITIGNFIEPRFLGKGLGLSTLVVFLSLIFWGWIFGIAGMFLAVPLTMSLKIGLETNPNTRWIAVLLSDSNKKV